MEVISRSLLTPGVGVDQYFSVEDVADSEVFHTKIQGIADSLASQDALTYKRPVREQKFDGTIFGLADNSAEFVKITDDLEVRANGLFGNGTLYHTLIFQVS
mmetsp:Transcript_39823/g.101837  ORF Transcript_39823/g.101837 Transcript_39823/m.101837 type:complete len:102 (+) Transcript_39823:275-580(+)